MKKRNLATKLLLKKVTISPMGNDHAYAIAGGVGETYGCPTGNPTYQPNCTLGKCFEKNTYQPNCTLGVCIGGNNTTACPTTSNMCPTSPEVNCA